MTYPKAPLGDTLRKFAELYLKGGGNIDSLKGANSSNPWKAMLSVARVSDQDQERLFRHDLSRADGGIETIPKTLNWLESYKAGETGFKSISDRETELRYERNYRAATLAESILYAAVTPKLPEECLKVLRISLTGENLGVAFNGTRFAIQILHFNDQPELHLIPQGFRQPSCEYLVVPR